jgi:integrase
MSNTTKDTPEKKAALQPTNVQFLYRHQNRRYYVRTYSGGKEKWTSLKTDLLSVAKNRMREHLDASERQRLSGGVQEASGKLLFSNLMAQYKESLSLSDVRPKTKQYREAGLKLVLKTWPEIEEMNIRRMTAKMVEDWLRRFKANATPYVPRGAKSASHNSTGASVTTIKCALDAIRLTLDIAVESGQLYANPARNSNVTDVAKKMFKVARREKAEKGGLRLPTREEFMKLVDYIRNAGVAECKAAANFVQFIAFCGARKNEAVNVLWSDIDAVRNTICLRVTKNGELRHVPMTQEMAALLDLMRDAQKPQPTDSVLRVKAAQGFIDSACKALHIPRFTTHALRHLFGTACLEAGVDVRTVAGWLGHKDNGALLLKVYSHIREQHESEMIRKVRFAPSASPEVTATNPVVSGASSAVDSTRPSSLPTRP